MFVYIYTNTNIWSVFNDTPCAFILKGFQGDGVIKQQFFNLEIESIGHLLICSLCLLSHFLLYHCLLPFPPSILDAGFDSSDEPSSVKQDSGEADGLKTEPRSTASIHATPPLLHPLASRETETRRAPSGGPHLRPLWSHLATNRGDPRSRWGPGCRRRPHL